MANKIKIKRGTTTTPMLESGEIAINFSENNFFVGSENGNIEFLNKDKTNEIVNKSLDKAIKNNKKNFTDFLTGTKDTNLFQVTREEEFIKMQGGCIINNKICYFILNNDETKAKFTEIDIDTKKITREKIFENLGHFNDITYNYDNNTIIAIYKNNNVLVINYNTLSYIIETINIVDSFQGVEYYNKNLYLKSIDHTTIYHYDYSLKKLISSFMLQKPSLYSQLSQGITIKNDVLFDVRGLPSSIYTYDLNGNFLSSFTFPKTGKLISTNELEFISFKDETTLYYGSFGTYNGNGIHLLGYFNLINNIATINNLNGTNISGLDSVYVNSNYSGNDSDGTIDKPFKHIEIALSIIRNTKNKRIRILDGEYNNVVIQNMGKLEIYFSNNAKINGILINRTDIYFDNANIGYNSSFNNGIAISQTDGKLYFGGTSTIQSDTNYPIYIVGGECIGNDITFITNSEFNYYANNSIIHNATKPYALNYSIILFKNNTSYNGNIDKSCIHNGNMFINVNNLQSGNTSINSPSCFRNIRVRVNCEGIENYQTLTQLNGATSTRVYNTSITVIKNNIPYLAYINFNYDDRTKLLTIKENGIIKLTDGTKYINGTDTNNPIGYCKINQVVFSN